MTRLHHVKRARKDNPAVKAGESYYWFKFFRGPKHYSATRPSRSQLTESPFFSRLYEIQDSMSDVYNEEDAQGLVEDLTDLVDMCQESLEVMPENFQTAGEVGEILLVLVLLQEWIQAIEDLEWSELSPEDAAEEIRCSDPFA